MAQRRFPHDVAFRRCAAALAVAAAFALPGAARAFEIQTGNPDISVRWDNTIRYNLGWRVESRDQEIGNSIIADDGTYSFDKNDVVQNRLDLLTEFDVVWKKKYGFRLSAAGWYDNAYDGHRPRGNPALVVPNLPATGPFPALRQALPNGGQFVSYDNNEYSLVHQAPVRRSVGRDPRCVRVRELRHRQHAARRQGRPSHGLLGRVAAARRRPARHLVRADAARPAEGLRHAGLGSQGTVPSAVDLSMQTQLSKDLSVAAQYFFEWESARYPEGGTYLGPVDFAFNGPNRQIVPQPGLPTAAGPALGFLNLARAPAAEPGQSGDFGLGARWSPDWLDGTLGFYYRNYSDKLPQLLITSINPTPLYFANTSPLGRGRRPQRPVPPGLRRRHPPVRRHPVEEHRRRQRRRGVLVSAEHAAAARRRSATWPASPDQRQASTPGALGDTYHGLVNALGTIAKTPLFDSAVYPAELTWMHWDKVTQTTRLFKAEGADC